MTQQNDPAQTLETTTLREMFQGPVLLVTYDGIKKVNITEIEKYEIQTSTGSFNKIDILFCLMPESADNLGNALRINKEVEAEKLRTDKDPHERPKIIGKRPMRKLAQKNVKVTLRNGHILYGIPIEYNEYNFTMNVNNQMVLVYRHAVYQFEIVNTQKRESTAAQK
jgi:sRNA-binding regulator protein Hfq